MPVLIGWWVGSFLFYKIICDAVFEKNLSIIAAFVAAGLTTLIVFAVMQFYSSQNGQVLARVTLGTAKAHEFWQKTFPMLLVTITANLITLRLVIFGFSKRLNSELFPDYRGRIFTDGFNELLLIAAAPIAAHYFMLLYGHSALAGRIQNRQTSDSSSFVDDGDILSEFRFKSGSEAFDYICRFMPVQINSDKLLTGLVLKVHEKRPDGIQVAVVNLPNKVGGTVGVAQTVSENGPHLQVGDLVVIMAGEFIESGYDMWSGIILSTLEPEWSAETGWKTKERFRVS